MTKVEYIKESHAQTNRKIWQTFDALYRHLQKNSILLAYIWRGFSALLYAIVYMVSWLAFAVTLFRDVKYSLHFMECDIAKQQLDEIQARFYLDDRYVAYKRQLSYGNYSFRQRARINHTFEYLFSKYPPPTTSDSPNEKIIKSLTTITDSTQQIHSKIISADEKINTIKNYTESQKEKDRQREIFEADLKAKAEQRKQSAYRKPEAVPNTFNCTLSDKQLAILTDYCNRLRVFTRDVMPDELKEVFLCIHRQPLQARHNKLLAVLLSYLSESDYISDKWQRIAGKFQCFTSKNGKLLNARDLSSAKLKSDVLNARDEELIDDCILEIKKMR